MNQTKALPGQEPETTAPEATAPTFDSGQEPETTAAITRPEQIAARLPLDQLLPAARAGDQLAVTELCRRFTPLIKSVARRFSYGVPQNEEDYRSIATLALLHLIQNYNLQRTEHFPGLAKLRLNSAVIDALRRKTSAGRHEQLTDYQNDTDPLSFRAIQVTGDESPELSFMDRESHRGLQAAWTALPEPDRQLLQLIYFERRELKEIAAELKLNRVTVSRRKKGALTRLRQLLEAEG